MTVEISDVVDGTDYDRVLDAEIMIIADHLAWEDKAHFRLLYEKIQWYLVVIESESEMDRGPYNDRLGGTIIQLMCRYLPDERAINFLNEQAIMLQLSEVGFRCKVLKHEDYLKYPTSGRRMPFHRLVQKYVGDAWIDVKLDSLKPSFLSRTLHFLALPLLIGVVMVYKLPMALIRGIRKLRD